MSLQEFILTVFVGCRNLHVRDLWDILHVYVAPSQIPGAGEGLFARQEIQPGRIFI